MADHWCNEYIRIPFSDHGRTREGADCWGLVRLVYQDRLNTLLPSYDEYVDTLDKDKISTMVSDNQKLDCWAEINVGCEKELDVLVFKMMGVPMHVGIVIGKGFMLHCQKGCGTHVSDYVKDQEWSRRLVGIYRHATGPDSSITLSNHA